MNKKISFIDELSLFFEQYKINSEDTCIVGSSVLALYNIRKNNDIDLIITNKIRNSFFGTDKSIKVSKNIEIVPKNWLNIHNDFDDIIINNPKYHHKYHDYKVARIELIFLHKSFSKKNKAISDRKLLKSYIKRSHCFNKRMLYFLFFQYKVNYLLTKIKKMTNYG